MFPRMPATLTRPDSGDARLWLLAVLASLGVNAAVVLVLAVAAVRALVFAPPADAGAAADPGERSIQIQPVMRAAPAVAESGERRGFARTSEDQSAGIPEEPRFIGERDTLATSERAADAEAPELPSQSGIEPRVPGEVETTVSDYQDGGLEASGSPGEPAETVPASEPAELAEAASSAEEAAAPPRFEAAEEGEPGGRRERLAEGPRSVELPVPPDLAEESPKSPPKSENQQPEREQVEERPKENPAREARVSGGGDPGFRGYQRKTELKGSISRRGRSALDVKAGPLGRYHADLSRAIEREWQRQVVRNRDFITPGVLRIRVVLDENGRVRSVGTVEEVGVGTIQKGFTHAAIREAELPAMPPEVRRELDGDPLELLYNFIF